MTIRPAPTLVGALACAAMLALAGCATAPAGDAREEVRRLVEQRSMQPSPNVPPAALDTHIAGLLATPLTVEHAVDIALLNNRTLRAAYAELGIAEADLLQAGRIANPVFAFSRVTGADGLEIERTFTLPIISLLTMPIALPLEQRRAELARMRTAAEALRIADQTRRAYFSAVAAEQSAIYLEQVRSAAEASAELAQRMAQAGNWSRLQQSREQGFYADASTQLARARQQRTMEREALTRLMGLWGTATAFTLPDRLPDLPAALRELHDAEADAMSNRLDVLMAQKELAGLSRSLGLTRATSFINLLDLSYLRNRKESGARASGYEIALQVPLFDWGGARVAKAEASYMQALERASGIAIEARSQVREAYGAYRTTLDIARHYRDEVVPLKKRISDEQLLRYNGMLISVFELLADAREQVISVNASIAAQRDFWIADSALQAALTGAASQQ